MGGDYIRQFSETWNIFVDMKLPAFLRAAGPGEDQDDSYSETSAPPPLAKLMTPLVGTFLGLCIYVPAWAMIKIFGVSAGGIATGVLAPLFLEMATGWAGLNALSSYINMRRRGATQDEALAAEPESIDEVKAPPSMIVMMSVYILKAGMFGILAAVSSPSWVIVALTGAYLVRAELASLKRPGEDESMFPTEDKLQRYHWHIAFVMMVIFGVASIPGALAAFALAWVMAWFSTNLCLGSVSGITPTAMNVFGSAAEIILLFFGVLVLS